jgi:hypothetical protein
MVQLSRQLVFASASVALGLFAFKKVNEVSGPAFEPIIEACTDSSIAIEDFAEKTGYHEYEPRVGLKVFNVLVCIITQFLFELRNTYPEGVLTWCSLMVVSLPFAIVSTLESGRGGAKGPIRYPLILGLLYQLFGISVMAPLVWVPAYIYGAGSGGLSTFRTNAAIPISLPGLLLTMIVFTADTAGKLWTTCAGTLGGPILIMISVVTLWGDAPPSDDTYKARISSGKAAAFAYRAMVPVSLLAWYALVYIAYSTYGTDVLALWRAVWTDANASVAFMTIDAIVLFVAILLYLAYRSLESCIQAMALTPILGPGAACAFVMADLELEAVASMQVSKMA